MTLPRDSARRDRSYHASRNTPTLVALITISSSLAGEFRCSSSAFYRGRTENTLKDSLCGACREAVCFAGPSMLSTRSDAILSDTKQLFPTSTYGSNQLWMSCTKLLENDVSSAARPLTFPKSVAEGSDDEGWDDELETR